VTVTVPLILTLLVGAVLSPHVTTLICRYTGAVMPSTACCPVEVASDAADHDARARIRDPGCCVVERVDLTAGPSERPAREPFARWRPDGRRSGSPVAAGGDGGAAFEPVPIASTSFALLGRSPLERGFLRPPDRPHPLSSKRALLI
jgi:hypothetical protein